MSRTTAPIKAGDAPYPRNQWYVGAYSHEVTAKPMQRWLLGEPVVFYRLAGGDPVALFDRCPHRGLRLSAGSLVGDELQCTYHGLRFGRDGRCTIIPSGGPVSPRMRVASYPVVERWKWIWIWMGDPEAADPALVPDIGRFGFGADGWYDEPSGLLPLKANYLLPFENLLDASHISFLHHGLIDAGNVAMLPFTLEESGPHLRVVREVMNEPISPLTMKTFGYECDRVNRRIIADATVPNMCGIRVEFTPADEPAAAPRVNQLIVGITPQSASTTLEFTAVAQSFPFANPNREEDVRNLLMEDVVAMEDIQQLFDQLGPERSIELSVRSDGPAMRMRQLVEQMLDAEARPTPAGAT
jgi:phenylpropionate dioxygenase-like ring-hydroxylating dioxygenase large terminal subunit